MDKKEGKPLRGELSNFSSVGVVLSLLVHLLWIWAFCYVAVYISNLSQRLDDINHANDHLQLEIDTLKEVHYYRYAFYENHVFNFQVIHVFYEWLICASMPCEWHSHVDNSGAAWCVSWQGNKISFALLSQSCHRNINICFVFQILVAFWSKDF